MTCARIFVSVSNVFKIFYFIVTDNFVRINMYKMVNSLRFL